MNTNGIEATNRTAVFWDFENTYYNLSNHLNSISPRSDAVDAVKSLRLALENTVTGAWQSQQAYADFEALPVRCGNALTRIGVETVNVSGAGRKNAADMKLTVDAVAMLHTQSYDTFVIIGGDRDYLPLVSHLRKNGRQVLVAAFANQLAEDLKAFLGDDNVIDLGEHVNLPTPAVEKAESESAVRPTATVSAITPNSVLARPAKPAYSVGQPIMAMVHNPASGLVGRASAPRTTPATTEQVSPASLDDVAVQLLTFIVDEYSLPYGWQNVWVNPMRRGFMTENSGFDFERFHRTLDHLVAQGAVTVKNQADTRHGRAGGFPVVVVHKNHPLVKQVVGQLLGKTSMSVAN